MWKKLFALLILFALTVPFYRSHIFSLNFVDEEDNIVIGSYLENGNKLYRDIYSQHQPIQFVMSNWLNTITKPDNILLTVKRHREFVLIWSMGWIILLTLRFGTPLFFVSAVLELTKIILLGNMFLAESLVIYPLLFLLSYLSQRSKIQLWEQLFVQAIFWFLILSLAPLWPFLAYLYIIFLAKNPSRLSLILQFIFLGLIILLCTSPWVDYSFYFRDAILINLQYYIPLTSPHSNLASLLSAIYSPFLILKSHGESILLPILKFLSFGVLLNIFFLFRSKQITLSFLIYLSLILVNLRYIDPNNTLYGAFHMLPFYATLIYIFFAFMPLRKLLRLLAISLSLVLSLNIAQNYLYIHRDPVTDYYIHYSPSEDLSNAIKIISGDKNYSLWVEPVNYWLHYQSGTKLYTTMINYYTWMDQTPPLKNELSMALSRQLPDILYLNNQNLALGDKFDLYTPVMRDGKATNLFIRSELIPMLSEEQKEHLAFYRFSL